MILVKPQLIMWAGNKITDHNRSDLSISYERIEAKNRMANGTLRKYVVTDKKTYRVSWENLPSISSKTVDGFWGKNDMESFYKTTYADFVMRLTYGNGTTEDVPVMFSEFSSSISKRGVVDLWSVDVSLEEV